MTAAIIAACIIGTVTALLAAIFAITSQERDDA